MIRPWTLCDRPAWARENAMSLDPTMAYTAVRIIGSVAAPGTVIGEKRAPVGTGFLATLESESLDGVRYGYVLTAHHVLWSQNRIEVQATAPSGELYPPLPIDDWRQPLPDLDLAIAPFHAGNTSGLVYQALDMKRQALPPGKWPGLGSKVYYIGILVPLNRAMARTGNIGAVNQHGIEHDGGYDYVAHLVDCRSYNGFSGSPFFVELLHPTLTPKPTEGTPGPVGEMHYTAMFCGMLTQHLANQQSQFASQYGVGTMLRSDEIWEALMSDDMREERRRWDAENKAAEDAADTPKLTNVSAPSDDEFERFTELTRELVNTPKPKVDEKKPAQ